MSDLAAAKPALANPLVNPAANAAPAPGTTAAAAARVTELRVSGHLMNLDPGLFCIAQTARPGLARDAAARDGSGLPGVRISAAPGRVGRPDLVSIATFRADGWLGPEDAALVRVEGGPAQVLVTIYQAAGQGAEMAPRLQVLRLGDVSAEAAPAPADAARAQQPVPPPATALGPLPSGGTGLLAHVSRAGDLTASLGEWVGMRGSKQWVEGFGISPPQGVAANELEYQAVLGRGWLSPWVEGGTFCGSRGMALPVLGIRARLTGRAAETHLLAYSATFVDGTAIGPVPAGEACEAETLAPLEAFQVMLTRKPQRVEPARPAAKAAPPPARKPRVLKSATPPRRSR
jgi:hypothetical protein